VVKCRRRATGTAFITAGTDLVAHIKAKFLGINLKIDAALAELKSWSIYVTQRHRRGIIGDKKSNEPNISNRLVC